MRVTGTDGWSWDAPFVHTKERYARTGDASLIWEGHRAGMEIGYCHLEKLHNLEALPATGFMVCCFPFSIKGASAGFTRAVAILEDVPLMGADRILPTTVVGSYPQPDWLIDRELLGTMVPRVRMPEIWRVPEACARAGAGRRDAARDPRHGARRDRHHHRRRDAPRELLEPLRHRPRRRRHRHPGDDHRPPGKPSRVPRIVGRIRRRHPVEVRDVEFLRRNTERTIKITLPGPFTMSRQAKNEFYDDEEELAMDFAAAVNEEAHDLKLAGADIIQLDEPWIETAPDVAARYALKAIDRAFAGVPGTDRAARVLWLRPARARQEPRPLRVPGAARRQCGRPDLDRGGAAQARSRRAEGIMRQTIILGVLDLGDPAIESAGGGGGAHPQRSRARAGGAARPGTGLRHEVPSQGDRLRQAAGAGAGRRDRAPRAAVTVKRVAKSDGIHQARRPVDGTETRLDGQEGDSNDLQRHLGHRCAPIETTSSAALT